MKQRCIMIFPKFHNMQVIEEIRQQYDPLFAKVHPHITLVFPFKSEISYQQLEADMQAKLQSFIPFHLQLSGLTVEDGGYLFLNVTAGTEVLAELHHRLYEGLLSSFYPAFLKTNTYKPHMTLGRSTDKEVLLEAVRKIKDSNEIFEDFVEGVSVEIIGEDDSSTIEMTLLFESCHNQSVQ